MQQDNSFNTAHGFPPPQIILQQLRKRGEEKDQRKSNEGQNVQVVPLSCTSMTVTSSETTPCAKSLTIADRKTALANQNKNTKHNTEKVLYSGINDSAKDTSRNNKDSIPIYTPLGELNPDAFNWNNNKSSESIHESPEASPIQSGNPPGANHSELHEQATSTPPGETDEIQNQINNDKNIQDERDNQLLSEIFPEYHQKNNKIDYKIKTPDSLSGSPNKNNQTEYPRKQGIPAKPIAPGTSSSIASNHLLVYSREHDSDSTHASTIKEEHPVATFIKRHQILKEIPRDREILMQYAASNGYTKSDVAIPIKIKEEEKSVVFDEKYRSVDRRIKELSNHQENITIESYKVPIPLFLAACFKVCGHLKALDKESQHPNHLQGLFKTLNKKPNILGNINPLGFIHILIEEIRKRPYPKKKDVVASGEDGQALLYLAIYWFDDALLTAKMRGYNTPHNINSIWNSTSGMQSIISFNKHHPWRAQLLSMHETVNESRITDLITLYSSGQRITKEALTIIFSRKLITYSVSAADTSIMEKLEAKITRLAHNKNKYTITVKLPENLTTDTAYNVIIKINKDSVSTPGFYRYTLSTRHQQNNLDNSNAQYRENRENRERERERERERANRKKLTFQNHFMCIGAATRDVLEYDKKESITELPRTTSAQQLTYQEPITSENLMAVIIRIPEVFPNPPRPKPKQNTIQKERNNHPGMADNPEQFRKLKDFASTHGNNKTIQQIVTYKEELMHLPELFAESPVLPPDSSNEQKNKDISEWADETVKNKKDETRKTDDCLTEDELAIAQACSLERNNGRNPDMDDNSFHIENNDNMEVDSTNNDRRQ